MKPVMVTTKHRGVFFGYGPAKATDGAITIKQSRMCVYWSADVRGVMGLASGGPTSSCRVTHALPEPVTLYDVTGVFGVSDDAVKKWESAPWS